MIVFDETELSKGKKVFVGGILLVPRVLAYVSTFKNSEMLLVTALSLCFGVSSLALSFEYSVALGAFLIGAIIASPNKNNAQGYIACGKEMKYIIGMIKPLAVIGKP